MTGILLNIVFVGCGAAVGGIVGWFLRPAPSTAPSPEPNPAPQAISPKLPSLSANEVNDVMARLQDLTVRVAADVDEHSICVQEINSELNVCRGDKDDVVDVVARIIKANEHLQSQLKDAEQKLGEQAKQIEQHVSEAKTDALTRLYNRRVFDEEIRRCHNDFLTNSRPSSVMMIDVDFFKKFNDTYGHQAGDEVLRTVAKTLRRSLQGKEVLCRYGGEEFAVIFPGSDLQSAIQGAERARVSLSNARIDFEGRSLRITASAGVAELLKGEGEAGLIKRADSALYASKQGGRNCGHWNDGRNNIRIPSEDTVTKSKTPKTPEQPTESEQVLEARRALLKSLSDQHAFRGDIERRLAEWKRGGTTISILMVRIDAFERFESVGGVSFKDTVMGIAAQFLKAAMRDMDHIAIIGEGTFGLTLPTAKLTDALAVGERIRKAIERGRFDHVIKDTRVSVSVGATECGQGDDVDELLDRTSEALESAVKNGGNRCFVLQATQTAQV